MDNWEWPQWVLAGMFIFCFLMNAARKELPKYTTVAEYKGYRFADIFLMLFILHAGGFWK